MTYKIIGDVTRITDKNGRTFIVDTEQLDKVKKFNWCVEKRKGYVVSRSRKIFTRYLHRYLLNTNQTVDHINRDKSDNRISNLRICTPAENNCNKGVRRDSTTGVKGIEYRSGRAKPYRARIQHDGIRIDLGYYETLEEAQKVYEDKAKELFKAYAPI